MKDFFIQLFQYSRYMNNELIKAIVEHNDLVSDKTLEWINHILNAHQIWNGRIKRQPLFGVWELHAMDELLSINEDNFQTSLSILDEFELSTIIEYKTTRGDVFKNSVRDLLFHIINHSTYHRAQIAVDSRQNGLEPLETDYDAYIHCQTQ
jgi:uncharacterized damage-inducible protein DinB